RRKSFVARATVALAAAMLGAHAYAQQVTLTETGSTLLAPLFETWRDAYAKAHPDVKLSVGATGSQAGIDQAIAGQVNIGASDAFMSDADAMKHPQIIR